MTTHPNLMPRLQKEQKYRYTLISSLGLHVLFQDEQAVADLHGFDSHKFEFICLMTQSKFSIQALKNLNLQSVKQNLEAHARNSSNSTDKTPTLYKMQMRLTTYCQLYMTNVGQSQLTSYRDLPQFLHDFMVDGYSSLFFDIQVAMHHNKFL